MADLAVEAPESAVQDQTTGARDTMSPELRKAAIIISMAGPEQATDICRRVDPLTAHRLIRALGNLGAPDGDERASVAREFIDRMDGAAGADALAARLKEQVLGIRSGLGALAGEDAESSLEKLALLDKADPNLVWRAISDETPQAIALVARHLSAPNCAKLLEIMPDETRREVTFRMSNPNPASPGALKAFARVASSLLKGSAGGSDSADANLQFVAEVVQQLNRKMAQDVLNAVKQRSEEIGASIERMIFKFTDLLRMPTPSLQVVLRNTTTNDLALALKGVPESLRELVFNNLSQRARSVLEEEMDLLGAVPATEAERAQQEIVQIARALESAGEITLDAGDIEYVE